MGISEFNRSHPFISQMEDIMLGLLRRKVENTKELMIYSIIIGIVSIACTLLVHSLLPSLLSLIYISIFIFLHLELLQDESHKKANDIINGYDYAVVRVNEKIAVEIVEDLLRYEGKMDQFMTVYRFGNKVVLAILGCNIIFQIVQLSIPYLV